VSASPHTSGTFFTASHTCDSTIDDAVNGLYYIVCYDLGVAAALPGAVPGGLFLHGYTGDALSFNAADYERGAAGGFFMVIPGGRGNNSATGSRDANARSPQDIKDVVEDARARYPGVLSPDVCLSVGAYSGGGGDAAALGVKLPGFICGFALFFPLLDYLDWYSYQPGQAPALLDVDIGDPADDVLPYHARFLGGALPRTLRAFDGDAPPVWIFWDSGDAVLDPQTMRDFVALCGAEGVTVTADESDDGTYEHGASYSAAGLVAAQDVYFPAMRAAVPVELPAAGSVPILGWVAFGDLSVWCGSSSDPRANDGGDRAGVFAYDTVTRIHRITPTLGPMYVDLRDGADTVRFPCSRTCIVDVVAGTVTEIDDEPAAPLLAGAAPLLSGTAPLLGVAPANVEPADIRTRTEIETE
jgi:hypothetical protein